MRWCLNPLCEIHLRHWGDTVTVFNAASGQTHFLNQAAIATLDLIRQRSDGDGTSTMELAALLDETKNADGATDPELLVYIEDIITSLDQLGIIEPCDP